MSALGQGGAPGLRASITSLKPFEAFRIEAENKTIIVACVEAGTFGVTCWFKDPNLEMHLQDVFNERGLEIRRAARNRLGRISIGAVVSGVEQGEVVVMKIATLLNVPLTPGPILPMIINSPVDLG